MPWKFTTVHAQSVYPECAHLYIATISRSYRAYAGGVVIIFKRLALIIVDHVLKEMRHFECMS